MKVIVEFNKNEFTECGFGSHKLYFYNLTQKEKELIKKAEKFEKETGLKVNKPNGLEFVCKIPDHWLPAFKNLPYKKKKEYILSVKEKN